ncbi:MAG: hypothetical protein NT170_01915 [Candidatus Moranbacteria bacterium]|nr:hypothetical protein [Candidatus Moranbacteria bacterium]
MKIFLGILVFFLAFGWLVLLLAATGLFYFGAIVLSILASFVLAWLFLPKISQNIDFKTGKIFGLVALLSLVISLAACHFATPTVFGGRDQGSIGTAAIYLSQGHNSKVNLPVAHDLFQKYGPGKALNFPGFDYAKDGSLFSRFPLGFTSYLAASYNLFGLKGIQYANFVPLFFFLILNWLIIKEFFDDKVSLLGYLLAATFFPFLWFAKYALTETYTLFLVWAGIYFLLRFQSQNQGRTLGKSQGSTLVWFSLAAFALSALVRIEGIVFFFLAAIYILLLQRKKILDLPKNFKRNLVIATLVLLALYFFLNFPDLIDSGKNLVKAFLPNSAKESAPSANMYEYLARIFFNYNLLAYILIGLVGIILLAKNIRKNWLKTEFLPLFLTFPTFIYLLSPMITLDEPWFLRRFVFAVFPALLLYSIYALQKFFYHKMFLYFVLVVLIVANGVVSWRFFTTSENKELLPQIEKISQKFGSDDLILVDRMATGSGFSLASEPLQTIYGKQAVYFMNADDLKFINQDRYKNIYLLTPLISEEQNPWYADLVTDKSPADAQIITNNFLEPADNKYALAQNVETKDLMVVWKVK